MKKTLAILFIGCLSLSVEADREKPVVFVDKFIPNEGCLMTDGQIQILQDRILGNVTSSRKYAVVDRENLTKVQQELKLVDAGLTEGNAPESNLLKAAGYCVYGKILQYRSYEQDLDVQKRLCGIIELQIRIENIATGQILAAKTIKCEKMGSMMVGVQTTQDLSLEVMTAVTEEASKDVVIKLNEIAFPVYVDDADGKYVTGNVSEEQVKVGEVWDVWKLGKKIMDRDTGKWTGRYREKLLCKVKVALPGAKATKFEVLNVDDGKVIEEFVENDVQMILRKSGQTPVEPSKKKSERASSRLNKLR